MDQNYEKNIFSPQHELPNATAVLVLGIVSIVGCFCYVLPGLVCGIIAWILARKDLALYNSSPGRYTQSSFNNLKAGRICAIIGLVFSGIGVILSIAYISFLSAYLSNNPDFWKGIK